MAWYATLVHYRPWGWIVTASLTLLCALSLHNLAMWRRHRGAMAKIVAHPRVWIVDSVLLAAGAGFAVAAGLLITGSDVWMTVTIAAAALGLMLKALYFNPWLSLGVLIDVGLIALVGTSWATTLV